MIGLYKKRWNFIMSVSLTNSGNISLSFLFCNKCTCICTYKGMVLGMLIYGVERSLFFFRHCNWFLATQVSQHKISSLRWRCYDDVIILCRDLDPDHILNLKKCQVKWFLSCVYYNEMRYNWLFFSLSVIQIN